MNKTPFEQFKDKEYKGDALLRLIVSDILLTRGVRRTEMHYANRYLSNEHLASVFDALKLEFHPDDIDEPWIKPFKRKGNTVEHHIWEYFEANGYDATVEYFMSFVN
jgi:hypothetical protein